MTTSQTHTLDLASDARSAGTMITDARTTVGLVKWDVQNNGRALTTLHGEPIRISEIILSSDGRIFVGTMRQTRKGTDYVRNGYMWVSVDMLDATMAETVRMTVASTPELDVTAPIVARDYVVTYWDDTVQTVTSESARNAALTIWDAEYLYRYSVDPDLLDVPDTMEILSTYGDHVATIVAAPVEAPDSDNDDPTDDDRSDDAVQECLKRAPMLPAPTEPPVSPSAQDNVCTAFAKCTRQAVAWVNHPIIGAYPSCRECAAILGTDLKELCWDHSEWEAFPFSDISYGTPCDPGPRSLGMCPECLSQHTGECAECAAEISRTADAS